MGKEDLLWTGGLFGALSGLFLILHTITTVATGGELWIWEPFIGVPQLIASVCILKKMYSFSTSAFVGSLLIVSMYIAYQDPTLVGGDWGPGIIMTNIIATVTLGLGVLAQSSAERLPAKVRGTNGYEFFVKLK
jgi:hypothetical protein